MKENIEELGERFLKRFEDLQPTVQFRDDAAILCSLRLHEVFRVIHDPVLVMLATNESIERAFAEDPDWLDNRIGQSFSDGRRNRLLLFVLGGSGNSGRAERLLRSQISGLDSPIIPARVLFARNRSPVYSVREAVVQYVPTRYFSPYQIHQVAQEKMFVGRRHLLRELRANRGSQVIVGPRRIGKSSLARHLEKLLGNVDRFAADNDRMPRCSYTEISELGESASERIWHSILRHFNLQRRDFSAGGRIVKLVGATRRDDRTALIDEAQALGSLIRAFQGQLTIILDEVDRWIESEASDGWPTLDRLRAMSDEGRAHVILIGYESLALAAENDRFPFAGRGSKLRLGSLELPEVEQLVTEPMEELGLGFAGRDQIINLIWSTTSGMPHIVQDICLHIVELAFQRKDERTITMAMLKTAIDSSPTVKTFRHPLAQCTLPLAEAVAGVLSAVHPTAESGYLGTESPEPRISLTIDEIAALLEQEDYTYDSRDFERALAYLELRCVLEATDSARTRWKWVNDTARRTTQISIDGTGKRRWLQGVLARHKESLWRARYQLLESRNIP